MQINKTLILLKMFRKALSTIIYGRQIFKHFQIIQTYFNLVRSISVQYLIIVYN